MPVGGRTTLPGGASSTGTEVLVEVDVSGTEGGVVPVVGGTDGGVVDVVPGGRVVQVGCSGWTSHFQAPATSPVRARYPSGEATRMDRAMIFRRMP
jgi:hypothetical protein